MAKVRTSDLINLDDHELLVEMARSERAREFDTSNTLNISLTRMVSGFFCQILDFYIASYYVL